MSTGIHPLVLYQSGLLCVQASGPTMISESASLALRVNPFCMRSPED